MDRQTKEHLSISLNLKMKELIGISPKLSIYKKIEQEVNELRSRLGLKQLDPAKARAQVITKNKTKNRDIKMGYRDIKNPLFHE